MIASIRALDGLKSFDPGAKTAIINDSLYFPLTLTPRHKLLPDMAFPNRSLRSPPHLEAVFQKTVREAARTPSKQRRKSSYDVSAL